MNDRYDDDVPTILTPGAWLFVPSDYECIDEYESNGQRIIVFERV
jgi:hypothetical protein